MTADALERRLGTLAQLIRVWCEDGSDECAQPIEFIVGTVEPEIQKVLAMVRAGGVEPPPEKVYRVPREAVADVVHYEMGGLEADMETVVLFCIECRLKFPNHTQDCRSRMARGDVETPPAEPPSDETVLQWVCRNRINDGLHFDHDYELRHISQHRVQYQSEFRARQIIAKARGAVEPPVQEPLTDVQKMFVLLAEVRRCIHDELFTSAQRKVDAIETLLRGARPSPPPADVVDLLREMTKDDCLPNTEYCWWCGADINGLSSAVSVPHMPDCLYVRAQKFITASPPPATPQWLEDAERRLHAFIREQDPGGCRIPSKGEACECPLCDVDRLVAAVEALPAAPHGADTPGPETK